MRITLRGWGRDCGIKELIDLDLKEMQLSDDRRQTVYTSQPGLFRAVGQVVVAWCQQMRHMGRYRMEIQFTNDDVIKLFKARFGKQLRPWLLEEEGFTVSDEFKSHVLRTVKLSDVTLGDLAAMNAAEAGQASAAKLIEAPSVPRLRRL